VVPFALACGNCSYCKSGLTSACDNSNPNAWLLETKDGYSGAGLFGCSHFYGGYAGGQAEYVRVPYGDVGPLKVPESITDEQALFLSDLLPTGYMATENCGIKRGIRSPCGAVALLASSRSRVRSCWEQAASLPSIVFPKGWRWRSAQTRKRSTMKE
jgi:threonine dehydrogenase-like Zn-dependent dehydrogenase